MAAKNKSLPVWNSVGSVTMSADRVAAIWTVKHFGVVTLLTESGVEGKFVAAEHLPAEPFQVTGINLYDQTYDAGNLHF